MESAKSEAARNPTTSTVEKADRAAQIMAKLHNAKFMLSLAGVADIYGQYGTIVNIIQKVNLLPHERMDKFFAAVDKLALMIGSLDHMKCEEEKKKNKHAKCRWPFYHEDLNSFSEKHEIQGVPIVEQNFVADSRGANTTRESEKRLETERAASLELVENRLKALAEKLHSGLKEKVFHQEDRELINCTRNIVDVIKMAKEIKGKEGGYIKIASKNQKMFLKSIRQLPVRSLDAISDEMLQSQHKEFLKRIEIVTKDISNQQIGHTDPKDILKKFFDSKNDEQLYQDIEMVLQAVAVACFKYSVESVLESFTSVYENHFDSRRNLAEYSAAEEIKIAINGPNCDSVLKRAMNAYWMSKKRSNWHFKRTTEEKHFYDVSKVVDRITVQPSRLPFMD